MLGKLTLNVQRKGKNMKRSLLALLAISVLVGFTAYGQLSKHQRELQGVKPYIPTRLEWLAVELNAYYRTDDLGGLGYTITFISNEKEDTILLYVHYMRSANREAMNLAVDSARKVFNITVQSKGWDDWVRLKERVEMADVQHK